MALIKTNIGTKPDGTPLYHYHQTDPSVPVVITGPITGAVTLPDGKAVDVTADVVEAKSEAHALEIAEAIGARFADEGHPVHGDDVPFTHTPAKKKG